MSTGTITKVAFDKSPEMFKEYGDRGIQNAIESGTITEQDGKLIDFFVRQLQVENNIGYRRAYKIRNSLSNAARYFKTPFTDNTILDLYDGFEALKSAKKNKRYKSGSLIETKTPLSPNTIHDYMAFMKRFFLWLIDEKHTDLPRSKVEKIKPIKPDKVTKTAEDLLTEQQVQDMINTCTTSRDRAIIATLYEGAFRIGEIGMMEWQDIDFSDKHFLTVRTDFKTGNERHIPLHTARPYLIQWMNDYPGDPTGENPVFVSQYRTTLTYASIKQQLNVIAKKAGIEKHLSPHIFRHSRITHMIRQGWTDSTVKSIAWGNLETGMFKTYVHLTKDDVINEARKQNGIEAPEEQAQTDALKPRQCGRCLTLNTPTDNFCSVCGNPLTEEIAADLQSMKEEIHGEPAFMNLIKNLEEKIEALQSLS